MKVLPRSFYDRNTKIVARELLGKFIVRKLGKRKLIGRIVETEAYLEKDPASHAYRGRTPRSAPMFEHPGHAYVYFIYGNHYCLNAVTEQHGKAGAVLIRALEPINGIKPATNGPGKLTKALRIDKKFNRADLTKGDLIIAEGKRKKITIIAASRIGLSKASDKKYRFYVKHNKYVSR
ncbi:DNA-3-methyladenine glycosylase [Candidatus Margulisiibacteriota bacterium]